MKELRLGDIIASFDKTGALVFTDAYKENKEICWINKIGVTALKKFIEDNMEEQDEI